MRIKTETRISQSEYGSWDVEVRGVNMDDPTDTTPWFLDTFCGSKELAEESAARIRQYMKWIENDPNDEVDILP